MEFKMEFLTLILCVTPAIVESITISSNGNSPKTKMLGGMMVDVQQGFVPMTPNLELTTESSNYEKSRKFNTNSTKLALNERYRRLIPYMTFYYANDIAIPTTESTRNIEVEKAQIIEAQELANQRQAKKIYSQRNIPRYQGNRLTQHNIASANPTKIFYKNGVPVFQIPFNKVQTLNYNHLYTDLPGFDYGGRLVQKFNNQSPAITTTKRPFLNLYNEESPNIRYYLSEKEHSPKYKLVPYDQTPPYAQAPINIPFERFPVKVPYEQATPVKIPYEQAPPVKVPVKVSYDQAPQIKVSYEQPAPVKVLHDQTPVKLTYENTPVKLQYEQKKHQNENVYATRKPVLLSVLVPKELYVKPRPVRPPTIYDSGITAAIRKQPVVVSENYYQKQRPQSVVAEPVIESGFKPIANPVSYTTVPSIQTAADIFGTPSTTPDYHHEISTVAPVISEPNYYQYVVDQSNPEPINPLTSVTLASLLNSLQINKSIPKPITKENVASSIRTLLQVLNTLKAAKPPNVELVPFQGTPKPFKALNAVKESPILAHLRPEIVDSELEKDLHLAPISNPSQHLDDDRPSDHSSGSGVTSTQYPLRVTSDDEGGTPGRPGADYPILSTIPHTSFDCKTQRYKGFFADTETRCQVWHYCDLNGGQASFLCPNGTIFSQAGLTCDWWFNVRCDSTAQLYVLNESLYKFILPHSPKFPEDYSGPLVDKYLTLKFKEMEEEFKKNKNKQSDNKSDSEEDNSSEASTEETRSSASAEMDKRQLGELSEASVIIESPGNSGKVQRLQDD